MSLINEAEKEIQQNKKLKTIEILKNLFIEAIRKTVK